MKCKSTYCECSESARAACDGRLTHAEMRALYADPVPPAGGEPEVVAYLTNGGTNAMTAHNKQVAAWNAGRPLILLEDHRAHVTRLQAEVEKLQNVLRFSGNEADAYDTAALHRELEETQSELTKARELIGDLRADTQSGYLKAVQALHNWANQTTPRGYSNIVMTGTSCNQSATADKE